MKKFKITIEENLERTVEIEAKTKEEAMDIVNHQYRKQEIVLDADDFIEKNIYHTNDNKMICDSCSCGSKDFTVIESSCHAGNFDDGVMYLSNEVGQGFSKAVCEGCGKVDEKMDYNIEY